MPRRQPYTTSEILDRVEAILRRVGFVPFKESLSTRSRYYRMPGWIGLLRVSDHPKSANRHFFNHADPITASLTFNPDAPICFTEKVITDETAKAIGAYMVRSYPPPVEWQTPQVEAAD